MPSPVIFDIETGPLPRETLAALMPAAPPALGEFNPADVKLGNLKDEGLRAAKIEAARVKRAECVKAAADKQRQAEESFIEGAALSPLTGQVLAIGYRQDHRAEMGFAKDYDETNLLRWFWENITAWRREKTQLVGFNIFGFDLPFLVARSWANSVTVPAWIWQGDRLSRELFVDIADRWNAGRYPRQYIKLDALCKFFGVPGKSGSGADFAKLLESDSDLAAAYLLNDLECTRACAERMGVV